MSEEFNFKGLIDEAGVPNTEAALNREFKTLADAAALNVNNNADISPFWRFVRSLAVQPVLWLLEFLVNHVLRQSFVRTATGRFLDLLAWGVGLTRKAAVAAKGQLVFTRTTADSELEIPAGFIVATDPINGAVYRVATDTLTRFAVGEFERSVNVTATGEGEAFNLAAGYYRLMPNPIDRVSVTNETDWLFVPGADEENDHDLRLRIRNQYTAVNQYHTDAVYIALISRFAGISTDNVFLEHDAPRGPGTANAYVMLDIGNPSNAFIARIQSHITDDGNHGLGDDLRIYSIPESFHEVVCELWLPREMTDQSKAQLLTGVENMIRAAFRENTDYEPTLVSPWSLFSFSRLGKELHDQFSVIENVDFNVSRITSELDIPRLGSLIVREVSV
ncbi:baseplate J/gp47 family protein [Marinibactrum halimedae]|uniref:Baseplate protein J-like barrel domain-containing protein n=1 Tax=Marinibactrum halimedae TaxID=1444977 RepID=A0AA37T5W0_9GAMM|nr:baseplate J/gp47 family protein [Marinibactrum halimedae]MCD9458457.1 baseplate J/gp47 family protein [Marinibactrum halimedae]GLS26154.1 hypothetical protein GCM10007877_18690 [Marinibactrum halimedae]